MSAKKHKEIRKQAKLLRKYDKDCETRIRSAFLRNTLHSPFRVRIKIAWLIIKGVPGINKIKYIGPIP